jgi:glycosyltransferase involved in cell wall biosynthesis
MNPSRWLHVRTSPAICLNPRMHLLFRAGTALLEPLFHLNHIFGSTADWYYLQRIKRRPTILTLAAAGSVNSIDLLERVDRFVVEYPEALDSLSPAGIDRDRVRVILPPVDLASFRATPRPKGPLTVLFASSPEQAAWLTARGVPLLLDAAELRPQYQFRLLWRPWGDSGVVVEKWIAERGLRNIQFVVGRQSDMAKEYQSAHVTIAPFTNREHCKPAPNSIIESLASGRPVVTTPCVGLSGMLRESGAGLVCDPTPADLAERLDRLDADWESYSLRARELAEQSFGSERFVTAYQELYDDVLSR